MGHAIHGFLLLHVSEVSAHGIRYAASFLILCLWGGSYEKLPQEFRQLNNSPSVRLTLPACVKFSRVKIQHSMAHLADRARVIMRSPRPSVCEDFRGVHRHSHPISPYPKLCLGGWCFGVYARLPMAWKNFCSHGVSCFPSSCFASRPMAFIPLLRDLSDDCCILVVLHVFFLFEREAIVHTAIFLELSPLPFLCEGDVYRFL